jgi:hypothetical protein
LSRIGRKTLERKLSLSAIMQRASGEAIAEKALPRVEQARKPERGTFYYTPLLWIQKAAQLNGKTVAVGLALWRLKFLNKSLTFKIQLRLMRELGVDRYSMYRALIQLEKAGLLQRHPKRSGCGTVVTLIEV